MQSEQVIRMIKQFNPQIKLIVCIRNPVERAYSHYMQRNRFQNWKYNFDETVRKNDQDILDYGLYGVQLEHVLHHFPKDQVKIIIFEDFIKNPQKFLSDLFSFLNVNNFKIIKNSAPKNSMKEFHFKRLKKFINIIRALCRRYYYFRKVFYELFPGDKMLKFINKINIKNQILTKTKISIKTKDYLKKYYTQDKILLEQILGREILYWDDYRVNTNQKIENIL
jgi:hypothetical protein